MTPRNVYYPPTSPQQRKLLFETWEETGNVTRPAEKRMWGGRLFTTGSPVLTKMDMLDWKLVNRTGVPKETGCIAAEVENKVLELHDQHVDWVNIVWWMK